MTSPNRVAHLLDALAATCDARDWDLGVLYEGPNWSVGVEFPERELGIRGFEAENADLYEALLVTWQRVQAHCRALAATGAARRAGPS